MKAFAFLKTIRPMIDKHLPEIAIITGAGLDILAVVCGIKETPHAIDVLEDRKPQNTIEKVGVIVPCYWKTITCVTVGTLLILFGNHAHLERTAFALGLAATQRDKLLNMQEEARKLMGPKKAQEMEDNLEARKIDMDKVAAQNPVMINGDTMFICDWNNYAMYSSVEKIKDIATEILKDTMDYKQIDLADIEARIGLPCHGDYGKGWNIDHPPTLKIARWMEGPNGKPAGILTLEPEPQPGWVLNSDYLL